MSPINKIEDQVGKDSYLVFFFEFAIRIEYPRKAPYNKPTLKINE